MVASNNEAVVGADSIAVETIVIALLSYIIFEFATDWEYYVVFQVALVVVSVIMLFRVMAGRAEDPNMSILKSSLRWSSKFLQLILIGSLAALSIHASTYVEHFTPVTLFIVIAFVLTLSFVLLDQLVLGEYAATWMDIIFEETGDNVIGVVLRDIADFGKERIEAVMNDEAASPPQTDLKTVLFGIGSLSLLLIVNLPVWLILAEFFGGLAVAMLVVLSLYFLRDLTRYIYINYGAAQSFAELRWPLRWEFIWTVFMGILLAGVLGYDLTSIL